MKRKALVSILTVLIILTGGATLLADAVQIDLQLTHTYPGFDIAGVQNLLIDYNPNGILHNAQSYAGYCVDPASIWYDTTYSNYYLIPVPSTNNYLAVVWVFENYGTPANSFLASDVQNAIWTLMGMNTSGPLFGAYAGIVSAALQAVGNGGISTDGYMLAVSPSPTGYYGSQMQDFIIRMPVSTPEPASALLLGLGLLGVGILGRKRLS